MKVTLQYGSALSPLCFKIIIDIIAEEAGTKPAWVGLILFEDDCVLVSGTVEEVEKELYRRRAVIDRLITKDFELAHRKQRTMCNLVNGV